LRFPVAIALSPRTQVASLSFNDNRYAVTLAGTGDMGGSLELVRGQRDGRQLENLGQFQQVRLAQP